MSVKATAIFQIDPLRDLNFKTDSTIYILREAINLGIDVWICSPKMLSFSDNKASTWAYRVMDPSFSLSNPVKVSINDFNFFFIRQDPPFDMNYLTNCYLLELHTKFNKMPYFVNNPSSIKNFTEKIFPLYYKKIIPKTTITSNLNEFKKFLKIYKNLVLKKLYYKGGYGVYKTSISDQNAIDIFKKCSCNSTEPIIVQEYLDKVSNGDKRIILIDGLPKGVINRIPKKGEFKANLHLGGRAEKTVLTAKERKICSILEPVLKKNDLFLVGIDIIDEKLTEINVTSPTGLVQINEIEKKDLSSFIWKKLLKKINL